MKEIRLIVHWFFPSYIWDLIKLSLLLLSKTYNWITTFLSYIKVAFILSVTMINSVANSSVSFHRHIALVEDLLVVALNHSAICSHQLLTWLIECIQFIQVNFLYFLYWLLIFCYRVGILLSRKLIVCLIVIIDFEASYKAVLLCDIKIVALIWIS